MTHPALNLDLLTRQIAWAEASEQMLAGRHLDPETLAEFRGWGVWDQTVWAENSTLCGTAYCQAGQAVHQAGWNIRLPEFGTADLCVKDGEVRPIEDVATEVLGFTTDEAQVYFQPENAVRDLKALVDEFCTERGLTPVYSGVLT